jgi:hypothetical protein
MISRNRASSGVGAWALVWSFVLGLLVLGGLFWLVKGKLSTQVAQTDSRPGTLLRPDAVVPVTAPTERSGAHSTLPHDSSAARTPSGVVPDPGSSQPEASTATPPPYDPFARHGDEEPPARVLVAVGDMQLGVLNNAKVHDEAHLIELLTRLGGELEKGAPRESLVESYQKELSRYMEGEVELRGRDWLLGFAVGEARPLPTQEEWRPRPN